MKRRIVLRILSLLLAALSVATATAQTRTPGPAPARQPHPLVRLPGPPFAAGKPGPLAQTFPRHLAVTASAVNPNRTALYTAPFAHDYTSGGPNGDYGVFQVLYGDFLHNGHTDAVGVSVDGILTLLSNDGNGKFTRTSSNLSQSTNFINAVRAFAADLDGDGWLDIVALDNYKAGYVVWLNKGGGVFANAVRTDLAFPAPAKGRVQANGMALGDIDGDGAADLAFAYSIQDDVTGGAQIFLAVAKGNGDGTFQPPLVNGGLSLRFFAFCGGIELADMRGTGKLDIVANILIPDVSNGFGTFAVVPNTGSIRPGEIALPPQSQWIQASISRGGSFQLADVDGDGNLDVFAAPGTLGIYLLKGDGKGGLAPAQLAFVTNGISVGATLGDFNRDGYLDAAVFTDGLVSLFNGAGGGLFTANFVHEYPAGYAAPPVPKAIDLNGDSVPDLTIVDGFFNNLISLVNNGSGDFPSATAIRSANTGTAMPASSLSSLNFSVLAQGDYNGDGLMDLLIQESNTSIDIGLSNGKGGFLFTRAIVASTINALGLDVAERTQADFDGDGFQDVLFASSNGVAVGMSDGKGGIRKWVASPFPVTLSCEPYIGSSGDIDGDGKLDLAIAYPGDDFCGAPTTTVASGYLTLKGDGKGAFSASYTAAGSSVYAVRLADMNRDGKLDLLLNDVSPSAWGLSAVAGDGTIAPKSPPTVLYTSASLLYDFAVQDLNGDGSPDLVVSQTGVLNATDSTRSGVLFLAGNGDLTVNQTPRYLVDGGYATSITTADLNHDGIVDVLAALYPLSAERNGLAIVRGKNDGTYLAPDIYPMPIDDASHVNSQVFVGSYQTAGSVDVVMGGGDEFVPSVLVRNADTTGIQLTTNRTTAVPGDVVGFYAQMDTVPTNVATGSVTFLKDGTLLGTAPIQGNLASLQTSTLPLGTSHITASYAGDPTHLSVTSQPVTITVQGPAPDFTMTASSNSLSVLNGSGTSTLSLTTNASLVGSLDLSCVGLPATLACSFSPATSPLTPAQTSSIQLTVNRTSYEASVRGSSLRPVSAALACFCLLLGSTGRRRRRIILHCCVLFLAATSLTGCGGSGKQAQMAKFSVVAHVTSGTGGITHSIPMEVAVKQ